jgi:acetoin:2,6-dichlorophenolindophenol oxidoreductase subunit alpha
MNLAGQHDLNFLGALADPATPLAALTLLNQPTDALSKALGDMLQIRLAEEAVAGLVDDGLAKCPCHLGIGQEAVAVGVSMAVQSGDRVYGTHRSHSHYLALGGSLKAMMAEILGKASGVSRGMGGSMHLYAPEVGFEGSVPIVGATIPIAAGAALAAKMDGNGRIAIAYFGDGACEEGVFHEALNMAAVMKLPLLFVCENNLYSSHLDIKLRQPADSVARFARAHLWNTEVVDGNDVVAVAAAAGRLADGARQGRGPGFLEAVTFRWRGHVGPSENVDVGLRRSAEELAAWKKRDPIARLFSALVEQRNVSPHVLKEISEACRAQISAAVAEAKSDPYPEADALLNYVYGGA